ncbi:UNVERIFIED_CONTAM: hypothetical protein FKN15_061206, partial [Acipenser sinensis]
RILPSTSKTFVLKNLVPGVDYDLCVLAIFDDTVTFLAATKVIGCVQFTTRDDYPHCHSLHAHFLGGTLTVIVGGIIVVTLLVFTVAMMVKYRSCRDGSSQLPKVTDVYSQTNGNQPNVASLVPKHVVDKKQPPFTPEHERMVAHYGPKQQRKRLRPKYTGETHGSTVSGAKIALPAPGRSYGQEISDWRSSSVKAAPSDRPSGAPRAKRSCSFDMGEITTATCYSYAKRLSVIWTKRSQSVHGGLFLRCAEAADAAGNRAGLSNAEELEESVV